MLRNVVRVGLTALAVISSVQLAGCLSRQGIVGSAPPPAPPGNAGTPGFPFPLPIPGMPGGPTIPGGLPLPFPFPGQNAKPMPVDCHGPALLHTVACYGDTSESEEIRLHQLINDYRARQGLPSILYSASLSLVANRHARDLEENVHQLTHSFSDCYYNEQNVNTFTCMWQAPQRLKTQYPGRGFELSYYIGTGAAVADDVLASWQKDPYVNSLLVNQGPWAQTHWNAIGLGVYQGYALVWLGAESDPAR